jgi:hypothetical protein
VPAVRLSRGALQAGHIQGGMMDYRSGSDLGQQAKSFLSSFLNYLRTRSPEHWLFFAIGVIVGLLIG